MSEKFTRNLRKLLSDYFVSDNMVVDDISIDWWCSEDGLSVRLDNVLFQQRKVEGGGLSLR